MNDVPEDVAAFIAALKSGEIVNDYEVLRIALSTGDPYKNAIEAIGALVKAAVEYVMGKPEALDRGLAIGDALIIGELVPSRLRSEDLTDAPRLSDCLSFGADEVAKIALDDATGFSHEQRGAIHRLSQHLVYVRKLFDKAVAATLADEIGT